MKFYLAARYSRYHELREVRRQLEEMGHTVTSRWLAREFNATDAEVQAEDMQMPVDRVAQIALEDEEDVLQADAVVSFTEAMRKPTRGGRHAEFGIGRAAGKMMLIVGKREHVFHSLPGVRQFTCSHDFLEWVKSEIK